MIPPKLKGMLTNMKITELLNHDIKCSCGRVHRCDIKNVTIGHGVIAQLPELLKDKKSIILVADKNTYAVCGEKVKSLLGDKLSSECVFMQKEDLVPNEQAIAAVTEKMKADTDFVLGIGSGVINDTCKYVSYKAGITSGIIATAPSMDGFASSGAAMIIEGMKVTYTMHAPALILGDTEILKTAPVAMIASGYADIIGKYSALCDWRLAELIEGEPFCPNIYKTVKDSTDEVRSLAAKLVHKDEEAIGRLMEILVLIGACFTLNNSTRPGSGSEHHLSHYFEITGLLNNAPYFLHGTDVGYSTVVTASLRERIAKIEKPIFSSVDKKARILAYDRIYGKIAGEVAELQEKAGRYEKDPAVLYCDKWDKVIEIMKECPSAEEITEMLTDVGFDMSAFEKQYGREKIEKGILYGKDLKDRYSVLWLYYSLFAAEMM